MGKIYNQDLLAAAAAAYTSYVSANPTGLVTKEEFFEKFESNYLKFEEIAETKFEEDMRNKIKEENKKKELKESGEDAQYSATEDKLESFFQMLEKKIKLVPIAGDKLAYIPAYASLIMHFVRKEYTEIPIGSMIAIIAALIYFISPFDLIPDSIPGIGLIDDALVTGFCWKLVESDMAEYNKWRKETFNGEKK